MGHHKVKPFFPFDLTTSYDAYEHGGSAFFDGDGTDYLTARTINILHLQVNLQLRVGGIYRDIGTSSFFNIETGGLVLYYQAHCI